MKATKMHYILLEYYSKSNNYEQCHDIEAKQRIYFNRTIPPIFIRTCAKQCTDRDIVGLKTYRKVDHSGGRASQLALIWCARSDTEAADFTRYWVFV